MAPRTVLSPDLKERHVNMMAFAACIGFGLFLDSGKVIYIAGPGMALIAFLFACSVVWAVIGCLGEMSALFPVQGPLFEFPGRFLDESVGYATGWTSWFSWIVTLASEIMTVSQLFRFHFDESYLRQVGYPDASLSWSTRYDSPAVWVFIFLLIAGLFNLLPVRYYGEMEYIFGVCKITFISGLILFNIILSGLQLVPHGGDHFWTWDRPYGFATDGYVLAVNSTDSPTDVLSGNAGRFVALWTAISSIVFALIGFETIAISGPENRDLEKHETIKIATKKLTIRLTLLYTLAAFAGGLNVPYDDPYLAQAKWNSINGGQNSLFILAAVRNRLRGWPQFFNGFFIFSATTSGINSLYNASRILHALASIPEAWPLWAQSWRRRLERTSSQGVPMATVLVSWLFGLLAFLSIGADSAQTLSQMSTNATVSELLVYSVICASFIRFYHRIKQAADDPSVENRSAFNREDEQYPYRTSGQLFRAVYGLLFCILLLIFNGWTTFLVPFQVKDFIASYISIAAFLVLILLYHVKSDGINPLRWRWSASMEIQRPPPKVVVSSRRRGVLAFPDEKRKFTSNNMKAFIDWVWVWVK